MGTLVGGDENGESNQNEPGLGRDSDTAMTDGDPVSKWRYYDGASEKLLPLSEMFKAQVEADRVSKRIRAEEAKAEQAQQPAAREPERPAENPTADTTRRKHVRVAITFQSSRREAQKLLQSLELSRDLVFMSRIHNCERTRFANVEANERLLAAVEAGRHGGWLVEDGVKWKADRAAPRRQSSSGGQPQSRTPPSAADRAPAATGGWGTGASQRLFPNKADEMQGIVAEMSKMLQQFTETMMNLQQKNQPPEATSTPAAAQAEIEQLRKALAETKENAQVASHAATLKHQRQEDEIVELRRLLLLARTEITMVQNRLDRLERPLPTRHAAPGKKAVHPKYGGRPSSATSPVFAPTTPGQPHTATPTGTGTGTGQPLQTTGMLFQFGQQPATPQQMPLATVPEAPTAAATPEALPVMPQLATPPHQEGQSSTKRQASPGTVLSPLRPYQLFRESSGTYSAETYDTHWADRSDASDNDQFFAASAAFDGSESDQYGQ